MARRLLKATIEITYEVETDHYPAGETPQDMLKTDLEQDSAFILWTEGWDVMSAELTDLNSGAAATGS